MDRGPLGGCVRARNVLTMRSRGALLLAWIVSALAGVTGNGCSLALDSSRHMGGTETDGGVREDAEPLDGSTPSDAPPVSCSTDDECGAPGFSRCVRGTCAECMVHVDAPLPAFSEAGTRYASLSLTATGGVDDGAFHAAFLQFPTGEMARDGRWITYRASDGFMAHITPLAGQIGDGTFSSIAVRANESGNVAAHVFGITASAPEVFGWTGTFAPTDSMFALGPLTGDGAAIVPRSVIVGGTPGYPIRHVFRDKMTSSTTSILASLGESGGMASYVATGPLASAQRAEASGSSGTLAALAAEDVPDSVIVWDAAPGGMMTATTPLTIDTRGRTGRPSIVRVDVDRYVVLWPVNRTLASVWIMCTGPGLGCTPDAAPSSLDVGIASRFLALEAVGSSFLLVSAAEEASGWQVHVALVSPTAGELFISSDATTGLTAAVPSGDQIYDIQMAVVRTNVGVRALVGIASGRDETPPASTITFVRLETSCM